MTELEKQIRDRTASCIATANAYFQRHFPVPDVSFNLRGKSAGVAHLQSWRVRFNPVLLEQNSDAFLNEVVPHEISHLLVYALFGKVRPHGCEWQQIMKDVFGVQPRTTHQFDVSSVSGRSFSYRCGCRKEQLTIRRHNKVQRGQAQYICKLCHQPLIWSGSFDKG